jgi:hypothetical protein
MKLRIRRCRKKSNNKRGTNTSGRLISEKITKADRRISLENFVEKIILNCIRLSQLKHSSRGGVREFWSSGDRSSRRIENELKTSELIARKIEKVRVAIVKSRMNKRGNINNISNNSVVIEIALNLPKITNETNTIYIEQRYYRT